MTRALCASSLVPAGLVIESVVPGSEVVTITARGAAVSSPCPACGVASHRIHSRYLRQVSDLPCAGRSVCVRLHARRFRCHQPTCRQRIFVERFGDGLVPTRARRTARLDGVVHCLGLALGGRPAASVATRLKLPVSRDTLLRTVRRAHQADRPTHRA